MAAISKKATALSTPKPPKCCCGLELVRCPMGFLRDYLRGYEQGAGCDQCGQAINPKGELWHCIDNFSHHHPVGYDLCLKCGAAQSQSGNGAVAANCKYQLAADDDQKLQSAVQGIQGMSLYNKPAPPKPKETRSSIMIAGCTDSPQNVKVSKKKGAGNYLHGIGQDMANMEQYMNSKYDKWGDVNIVRDMKHLKKGTVLRRLLDSAQSAGKHDGHVLYVYYTGHGEEGSGNWCFKDGTVSLKEVVTTIKSQNKNTWVIIMADCCFSGNWARDLRAFKGKYDKVLIQSASAVGKPAYDSPSKEGGYATLVWTEKKKETDFKNLEQCLGVLANGKYDFYKK